MKINRVFIISWLGGDKDKSLVALSVSHWLSRGLKVTVIVQGYGELGCFPDTTEIIVLPSRASPALARNIALQNHYQSDDDYCLIVDDDTRMLKGDDFIDAIRSKCQSEVENLHMFTANVEIDRIQNSPNHWVMQTSDNGSGGWFMIKNLVKYGLEPMYFDLNFKWIGDNLIYGEDHEFIYNFYRSGLNAYRVADVEVNHVGGSSWEKDIFLDGDALGHAIYESKYGDKTPIKCNFIKMRK